MFRSLLAGEWHSVALEQIGVSLLDAVPWLLLINCKCRSGCTLSFGPYSPNGTHMASMDLGCVYHLQNRFFKYTFGEGYSLVNMIC